VNRTDGGLLGLPPKRERPVARGDPANRAPDEPEQAERRAIHARAVAGKEETMFKKKTSC